MASIRLDEIRKEFGAVVAVKELSLEIPDGRFAALLGPSGCGKTTTMNMIAGLETPTSGAIWFDDRMMNEVPPNERGVGFVFQNYAIFTHMTVYNNIAFGLKVAHIDPSDIRQEVMKVAELLQIGDMLHQNAGRLSVNDMQKVALGRSMITKPRIFLLDEPFSNLDAAFRAYMRGELKRIQREIGQTMIYVTHDQIEAMSMADLIAVMDSGSLQQFGTPYDVYNCPVNTFVANFIGNPNMNLIDCSFQVENGSAYLVLNGCSDSITLNGASKMLIENFRNSEQLILGIRPEHLHIYDGPVKPGLLPVSVHFVEPLGPKTVVHLRLGEQEVVRAIAPASFKSRIAEQRWIELDQDYLHIFDKKTSLAIL